MYYDIKYILNIMIMMARLLSAYDASLRDSSVGLVQYNKMVAGFLRKQHCALVFAARVRVNDPVLAGQDNNVGV